MAEEKRNYGVDLLRIVSMFLIAMLHTLAQGGAMVRIIGDEGTYYALWFLETCAYCSVDCYGLISGYVGVNSRFRPARFLELWFLVFFYQVLITGGFVLFAPHLVTSKNLYQTLFPVSWGTYWYFSAYAGLFVVMPFLNRMVNAMKDRELKGMALVLFVVFSAGTALPKVNGSDFLSLGGGYSFVWLVILYLLGAAIRRCSWKRHKNWQYLAAYFGLAAFSWAFKILMENYTRDVYGEARWGRMFTSFTAPTILLCAVCLFRLFEGLKISNRTVKKLIVIASPLAFSVYIIHVQPLIWQYVMKGAFSEYCYYSPPLAMLAVILTAFGICLLCGGIDFFRFQLFRLLHVRQGADKLVEGCVRFFHRLFPEKETAEH